MKNPLRKILSFIFDKNHEALILLGLPCLAIIIAAAVLIPRIDEIYYISRSRENKNQTSNLEASQPLQASPVPVNNTSSPTPSIKPSKDTVKLHLTTLSVEKDLYIFIRGEDENPVSGEVFKLDVIYPGGQKGCYDSKNDGTCYLVNLQPGSYSISMQEKEGYITPEPVKSTVKAAATYQKIDNIEEVIDLKPISEGLNEIAPNTVEVQEQTVVEYITSDSNVQESITSDNYVRDAGGNITYQYEYHYDDNNFLLYRDGSSSDVIPNIENGILVGGLRWNAEKQCYETVDLFNADNTVSANWWIDATPIARDGSGRSGWQTEGGEIYYYSNGERLTGLKNIDGKLYYFSNDGVRASSVGIDVSFYNGTINWNTVKNAGVDFVIIRAGFRGWGSAAIYQDTCFAANLRGAKTAGLKVGVYFYSTAVSKTEAIEEASIVLDWLGGTSLDYPVYIDMEFSGDYPNGRQDTLSPAQRVEVCQAFCETVRNSGYKPGIYMTQSFLKDEIDYNSVSNYNVWLASYTVNNQLPDFYKRYDIWQYTDNGRVAGINGAVDFNIIR